MTFTSERDVEAKLLQPLFVETLGYPANELEWAPSVTMHLGRQRLVKEADLVAKFRGRPVITVEAKAPTEPIQAHFGQLDSYAFHLQTPFGVITNGRQFVLRGYYSFNSRINVIDDAVDKLEHDHWSSVQNLISFSNISSSVADKANVVPAPDTDKIKDYRRYFRKLHNTIRDRDKLDPAAAFDELSKLLFLKASEEQWRTRDKSRPVLTPAEIKKWESLGQGTARKLINEWFEAATSELFPDVFDDHPQINLHPNTLERLLTDMEAFHIRGGDVDVKGRAFEEFLPSQLRGEGLGQFFTPRPIVNFMTAMADISIHDVVADFACGSGGFLIKAFEKMQSGVASLPEGTLRRMGQTRDDLLEEIKTYQIFGIDAEPRAARTAKMNMLMWGDGRKVVRGNALDKVDHLGRAFELQEYDPRNSGSGCTLILANPPFGSREKDPDILSQYLLGAKSQVKSSEKTEILFIEKGIRLLRPGGRMLIVLPQGLLSGVNNKRVRDFIHSECEVRAIVSLPTHTFVQSGVPTVNTCVVYLQKFTEEKRALLLRATAGSSLDDVGAIVRTDPAFDYPIFMATAEHIGYEPSGRSILAPGEKTDLDLILEDYSSGDTFEAPEADLFDFANRFHGERSHRRKDQSIRGTTKGLKTSLTVNLSDTEDRLDPPYYLFKSQAENVVTGLAPLKGHVEEAGPRFRPSSDEELDAEYPYASVSSDGVVTLSEFVRGEDFGPSYRPKQVRANDFVYNPMRINIGSIGLVPPEMDGALTSPDYIVFRATADVSPSYLLALLRSPFYRMYIDLITTGSIRDRLYFADLETIRIPLVSRREQTVVAEIIRRSEEEVQSANDLARLHRAGAIARINALLDVGVKEDAALDATFRALADTWRRETGYLSSPAKKTQHSAYQAIIALGAPAVPLILAELAEQSDHWFEALEKITGVSQASDTRRPGTADLTKAWLKWGRKNNLIE